MSAVDHRSSDALASLAAQRATLVGATVAVRAADLLREHVVEGALRPGTQLREQAVGAALGISRNTVREAMSVLIAERILVREPHRGVFVALPGVADVRDVYRARRILEPAAVLTGSADVGRVRAAVAEGLAAREAADGDGVARANQHFHRALVALAGSVRLDAQMDLLLAEMRLVFHRMPDVRGFHDPYLDRNGEICALLEAGERARAAARVAEYLDAAETELLEAYTALD